MAKNSRQPITINGVQYRSRSAAEWNLKLVTGTLARKLRGQSLPVTFELNGKKYTVSDG